MDYAPWNSGKNYAAEGDAGTDNALQSRLPGDMFSPHFYTRRCTAGEPVALKQERNSLELEEKDQGKFVSSVRNFTLARDAEIHDAMNGSDVMEHGSEHFRAEYGYRTLGEQLNTAKECDIIKERTNLMLETQSISTDSASIQKKSDVFKVGQHRTQHTDSVLQQYKMDTLYEEYEERKRERNALILNVEGIEEDKGAIRMERENMKLEKEIQRDLCKDDVQLKEHTNIVRANCADMGASKLKLRGNVEIRDALVKERESLELEREEFKVQCEDSDVTKDKLKFDRFEFMDAEKDTNNLELKTEARDGLKKRIDYLINETEKLRTESEENALLEEKLKSIILKCDKSVEDKDTYTLESQRLAADIGAIGKERHALRIKIKELQAQSKQNVLLEKQTSALFAQYEKKKRNKDDLVSKFQDIEEEQDIRTERDAMELQKDEIREQCKDSEQLKRQIKAAKVQCVYVNRDKEAVKLKVRRSLENRDALIKDRDALKLERQRLKVQCEDGEILPGELHFVSFQLRNLEEETNILLYKAETIDALRKERDALRIGIEKLRKKCEETAKLEGKLNALNIQREKSAKEKNTYTEEAQSVQDDIDAIEKENQVIRGDIEELRARYKDSAQLEKQVNSLFVQYQRIKRNRDNLILKLESIEESEEAIKMERDSMRLEKEQLRDQCKVGAQLKQQINVVRAQCVDISRERHELKSKVRRTADRKNSLMKERDALELERRQLKIQCEYSDVLQDKLNFESCRFKDMEKETNDLMLKAETINAMKKETDSLRSETERLRMQCKENALLEEKLNTQTLQREKTAKERDTYMIEAQRVEHDIDAIEKQNDAIKIEIEELRSQGKDGALLERKIKNLCAAYEIIRKNRNNLILKFEGMEDNEEVIRAERDSVRLDREKFLGLCQDGAQMKQQINVLRGQCVDINRDMEDLKLKVRRNVENREVLMKEREILEFERQQCGNSDLLSEEIQVAGFKFRIMEKERRSGNKGGDYRFPKYGEGCPEN
jgi:hypothetical protein